MDRNYTDFSAWRPYLAEVGANSARVQAGWARCEPALGVYDFNWLDEIVYGMVNLSVTPWLQTSYGNTLYEGGGNPSSGSSLPGSTAALAAWDAWVAALVSRYRHVVTTWEVWNEPEITKSEPADIAAFTARTAKIIRANQNSAVVRGGVFDSVDLAFATEFFGNLSARGALDAVDVLTYHPYVYNPDAVYTDVAKMAAIVTSFAPHVTLAQGENGAPSVPYTYGALGDYNWTTCSQAKWMSRRLVGDRARSIPSNAFTVVDICYVAGGKPDINTKGIIEATCPDKTVVGLKPAYGVVQRIFSTLDGTLAALTPGVNVSISAVPSAGGDGASVYVGVFTATDGSGRLLLTLWLDGATPVNAEQTVTTLFNVSVTLTGAAARGVAGQASSSPWSLADLMTGTLYALPQQPAVGVTGSEGGGSSVTVSVPFVPASDFAVLLGDTSLLPPQQGQAQLHRR